MFYGRTFASTYDMMTVAGMATTDASFDAEGFMTLKDTDVG